MTVKRPLTSVRRRWLDLLVDVAITVALVVGTLFLWLRVMGVV